MILKNIEPQSFEELQRELNSIKDLTERSANLIWYYLKARFQVSKEHFKERYYCDGANDGGIDCFYKEADNFYVVQSKYYEKSKTEDADSIIHEINKIEKTIIGHNTNDTAEEFIQTLRNNLKNEKAHLEIKWVTSNTVKGSTRKICEERIREIKNAHDWKINLEIDFIDRSELEGLIFDVIHGYVPYTGKKELQLRKTSIWK